ncbi:MAG: cyclic nucleotide-binding domain-containing protein, partial [Candidatus Acidiferrum sp.]
MTILAFPSRGMEKRADGCRLTDEILGQLELLAPLKRRPPLYRFKGAVSLRHVRRGDSVVERGREAARAYYVLTAADEFAVLRWQYHISRLRQPDRAAQFDLEAARSRAEKKEKPAAALRICAQPRRRPVIGNSQAYGTRADHHAIESSDRGPAIAIVHEGELLDEASCLLGTPHPATVVALRDCHLLEMRADYLRAVIEDPVYKARMEEAYRNHILRLQLGQLPLFCDLNDEEFGQIKDVVELSTVDPGNVIVDEHERCRGMYIVRAGVVKLVKYASALLGADDVADWQRLLSALGNDAGRKPGTIERLCSHLPDELARMIRSRGPSEYSETKFQMEILNALNDL